MLAVASPSAAMPPAVPLRVFCRCTRAAPRSARQMAAARANHLLRENRTPQLRCAQRRARRRRRIVSEAAKLMAPHEPKPGEEAHLVGLPTEILARPHAARGAARPGSRGRKGAQSLRAGGGRGSPAAAPQMKIVCSLRHDEMRPLLATCRRLRQAASARVPRPPSTTLPPRSPRLRGVQASAAIAVHFNFCTPEPLRDDRDGAIIAALRSPSPFYFRAALASMEDAPAAPHRRRVRTRHVKHSSASQPRLQAPPSVQREAAACSAAPALPQPGAQAAAMQLPERKQRLSFGGVRAARADRALMGAAAAVDEEDARPRAEAAAPAALRTRAGEVPPPTKKKKKANTNKP